MSVEIFRGNKEKIEICTFQELEIFVWVLNVVYTIPHECTKVFLNGNLAYKVMYGRGIVSHVFGRGEYTLLPKVSYIKKSVFHLDIPYTPQKLICLNI